MCVFGNGAKKNVSTTDDIYVGYTYSDFILEELRNCELISFELLIKEGIYFTMVGHISLPMLWRWHATIFIKMCNR